MLAEIPQTRLRRKIALHEIGGHARDEHLTAVPDREQARHAIDRGPKVIAIAFVGGAGVDRGADSKSINGREIFGGERALRVEHRADGIFWSRERGAERIADRLKDDAVVRRDGRAHQSVMTTHRILHGRAVAFPTRGAAFDVREREGHRAGGKWHVLLLRRRAHESPSSSASAIAACNVSAAPSASSRSSSSGASPSCTICMRRS